MKLQFRAIPLLVALCACASRAPDVGTATEPSNAAPAPTAAASLTTLTTTGLGPVQLGMTVHEAEQALQTALNPMAPGEEAACWMTRRADGQAPQIFYMVENDKITRINIGHMTGNTTTAIQTAEGIGLGATERDVLEAYGASIKVMPHKYDELGHILIMEGPDARAALLFETSDGKVTTFRAGVHPSVDYVEGCS